MNSVLKQVCMMIVCICTMFTHSAVYCANHYLLLSIHLPSWLHLVVCPCMNGGSCNPENFMAYNETVCLCPEVYTGALCERRQWMLNDA